MVDRSATIRRDVKLVSPRFLGQTKLELHAFIPFTELKYEISRAVIDPNPFLCRLAAVLARVFSFFLS